LVAVAETKVTSVVGSGSVTVAVVWLFGPLFAMLIVYVNVCAGRIGSGAPDFEIVSTVPIIVVESVSVSLLVISSPPPETVTELTKVLLGGLAATVTVKVMGGKLDAAARPSVRVQVRVATMQVQPVPDIAVAVKPVGSVSTTVTRDSGAIATDGLALLTVIV